MMTLWPVKLKIATKIPARDSWYALEKYQHGGARNVISKINRPTQLIIFLDVAVERSKWKTKKK
jgi:hypothetical protein